MSYEDKLKQYSHALSVRSDHSIGESILQVEKIAKKAKELGYQSVALTDTMSISALGQFSAECDKHGTRPILGCTLRMVDDPFYRTPKKNSLEKTKDNPEVNIKVYVKTERGLHSLMKLLSLGNTPEYFYYHSRVGLADVLELEDVVVTTGDINGLFHHPNWEEPLTELHKRFGDDFYVEIVPIYTPLYYTLTKRALKAIRELGCQPLLSYPVFYSSSEDSDTLDVLRAITSNTQTGSPTLPIPFIRDFAFDDVVTLVKRGRKVSELLELETGELMASVRNIGDIVNKCIYRFTKFAPCLPHMAEDAYQAVVDECKKGWVERFTKPVLGYKPDSSKLGEYRERLKYELSVIKDKGFADYFLLVQDLTRWSRQRGFTPSAGRGSSGGSLVSFLMGITQVDPIRFDLLFERFINPSRVDLPDIDMDFPSEHRQEVIQYIIDKYGADNVAAISNFVSLGAASSLRDVSRLSGLNPLDYACSKQVEKEHGISLSLEESAEKVPEIDKFRNRYPEIWKHATKLQGCMKNLGQHAAGVIVAGEPIVNRAVVSTRDTERILPIVCWDKKHVEDWGLIKMDVLGLSTLDLFKHALDMILKRRGKRINLLDTPLDDPKVMEAFGKGKTVGVFQFESTIMRKLLISLAKNRPLTFEDLCAATALNRPGPIEAGLVDEYVAIKNGEREPHYDHPLLESCLKNTFGVLTYQEQIMRTVQDLAGFTPVEAEKTRKAIGKKDLDTMVSLRGKFVEGAERAGMSDREAERLWDKIEGFAGYAFNRSHAVAYSVISYWCMYLKVYYPQEFFAGAMTIVDDEEKQKLLVKDALDYGIRVVPPDINRASDRIEIIDENTLMMSFQAIKGISSNVANYILKARDNHGKPFESITDFEKALSGVGLLGKVNKRHRDSMDRVGCFAAIEPDQKPATDISRLKDRLALLAGFTVETVKADRGINNEELAVIKLKEIIGETRKCEGCPLSGREHPLPRMGRKPKFMVVFDSPTWKEGAEGKLMVGDVGDFMKAGLEDQGLDFRNGYFTALVKSPKPKGIKGLTNEMINGCSDFLKREIEILKPPVIVAMGNNTIRHLLPDVKGTSADLAGRVVYKPELDANIVCGINPQQVIFAPEKVELIEQTFARVAELVN